MTFEQLAKVALECRDRGSAQALLRNVEGCLWELPYQPGLRVDAQIAIGYAGGYEDREDQLRLWRLFETEHFCFGPDENLTSAQLMVGGYRIAGRLEVPEHCERLQRFLDAHDFAGLRIWLRTALPGEPAWPDRDDRVVVFTLRDDS